MQKDSGCVSSSCSDKGPQTGRPTQHNFILSDPQTTSLQSRCGQGYALSGGWRGGSFGHLLASGGSSRPLACRHIASVFTSIYTWASLLSFQCHPTDATVFLFWAFLAKRRDATFLPRGCCTCCSLARALFHVLCAGFSLCSEVWEHMAIPGRLISNTLFSSFPFPLCFVWYSLCLATIYLLSVFYLLLFVDFSIWNNFSLTKMLQKQ